jgi:hypothetical protein
MSSQYLRVALAGLMRRNGASLLRQTQGRLAWIAQSLQLEGPRFVTDSDLNTDSLRVEIGRFFFYRRFINGPELNLDNAGHLRAFLSFLREACGNCSLSSIFIISQLVDFLKAVTLPGLESPLGEIFPELEQAFMAARGVQSVNSSTVLQTFSVSMAAFLDRNGRFSEGESGRFLDFIWRVFAKVEMDQSFADQLLTCSLGVFFAINRDIDLGTWQRRNGPVQGANSLHLEMLAICLDVPSFMDHLSDLTSLSFAIISTRWH